MKEKDITVNRIATHDYFILSKIEAGIVLDGGEVKSVRNGSCNLKDSFCVIYNGQLYIKNMHVAVYDKAGAFNVKDSRRDRKLLLHKKEIIKLFSRVKEKGFTIVCTKVYFSKGRAKAEIALAKGKALYDKRETQKKKDIDRENEKYGKIK